MDRATLAAPKLQPVNGGQLAKQRFYCVAILGVPSLWADAREAGREGHLIDAVKKAVTARAAAFRMPSDTISARPQVRPKPSL